jgi:hypothetical protein
MNITNAKYVADPYGENQQAYISATIDGVQWSLPNNALDNRHYAEIMRQVAANELTIEEAE